MKKCKITVMKKCFHADLALKYENPIEHACDLVVGEEFISENGEKPKDLCPSAWLSLQPFVMALAYGAENFFDGWMKNPKSAMISCNDGFRPVSFLIETL
ncbi:MAG: TIGR04076 family protein [Bacteroidales bacterium]|nr:TIGR04076 family protein [Bacteroidales bacterium]